MSLIDPVIDTIDTFIAWLSSSLKQTLESYCDLETADDHYTLVAHDGSLITVIRIDGATALMGQEEFTRLHQGFSESLQSTMSRSGHSIQVYFSYDRDAVVEQIRDIYTPANETAKKLRLDLDDLFKERLSYLSQFCAKEDVFMVLWTRPNYLTGDQFKRARKAKLKEFRDNKIPPFRNTQNVLAAYKNLREVHDAFVRAVVNDLYSFNVAVSKLEVHDAIYEIRRTVDPGFTDLAWRPVLVGDKIAIKEPKQFTGDISDIMWPSLARQVMPRDAENLDLRTARCGDQIFSTVFINLFPKDIKMFSQLLARTIPTQIPWRISFLTDSNGMPGLKFKGVLSKILSFSSVQNRLLSDSIELIHYFNTNTDEALVRFRVSATTWAPANDLPLLRTRTSELAKAIQGWGAADVSEISGDPFGGIVSSMLGVSAHSDATPSIAPLSDTIFMLPLTRPASPWQHGALLFRSPDGKPWPFQPGSSQQTTWIDLIYARPGSGKSVLSNALNLALCLSGGLQRLPRIAIIDVGPSSSGLISLLREALPDGQKHYVAYHRLRMSPDYSINPFDTQLGCRFPSAQERGFLVNFLTLLATPVGAEKPYHGITDMAGMVVDELFKSFTDGANPNIYTAGIEPLVDGILEEIGFIQDARTTWWEVTDALFSAGFTHEAILAQRFAMPLIADAASIVRGSAVEDLYGKIQAPTGEDLITAFSRMISAGVREYPVLSRVTSFDIGDARVVSLDLDEVAKGGGEAAERQTAVMYMLARYVLAKNFYITEESIKDVPEAYYDYHYNRFLEIKEDAKRIVYDEFHRTAKAAAVRDQVILDMREGRKWKVQVALASQSVDDFDEVMIDFATSTYIMDAGPEQSVRKSAKIFGLSDTAQVALRTRVHGPREGGGTFLAQFATKHGMNTQLLTLTLGPIELWAFSTTVEDVAIRNRLYKRMGPSEARRVLATLFPSGSIAKIVERRLAEVKETSGVIAEGSNTTAIDEVADEIMKAYSQNPNVQSISL